MLLEMLRGKVGCLAGKRFDATAFENCDESSKSTQEVLEDMLFALGLPRKGSEVFCDGRTGRKYDKELFMGTCYYQRLKHMVDDKIHARNKGPVHILTRQPIEGRARDGGLRFGEMYAFVFSLRV